MSSSLMNRLAILGSVLCGSWVPDLSRVVEYGVSMSLAHQYLSQFGKKKVDALSTVGASIIFNVDKRDAEYLIKDLQGKVKVEELVSMRQGEAIARIGSDIVRIKTRSPLPVPSMNFRDRIIFESRNKYYKPVGEIQRWLKRRGDRSSCSIIPVNSASGHFSSKGTAEFRYDEFD